ncbi:MAG TPA: tRNA lysidine(34) synthetase TilS [Thermoanaerobaculia bacterium]|jgi:tRNA(Ile)-lysidine synthetase-like protein|nr:tRNA lysidine(34) synthetase TilS [Thermoanaerobaculia bacterium]
MTLLATLRDFFSRPEFSPPRPVLVAFSGGTDSTALLAGLAALKDQGFPPAETLFAAHLDHGRDPSSAERARRAGASAALLGVPFLCKRRDVAALRAAGESWETAARRVRYEFLEEARLTCGAGWIALAHHRDDQAETVILRWLLGSGLYGLSAMREVHGTKVRPLLGRSKAELVAFVISRGLDAAEDPTNLDPASLRNRIRHHLLPALAAAERLPDFLARLSRLATRAAGASDAISALLAERFPSLAAAEPSLDLSAVQKLPRELLAPALAALSRAAGLPLPPSRQAVEELLRQLALPGGARTVGTTLGPHRRWRIDADRLSVETVRPGDSGDPSEISRFTYTFSVPGRIEVPEAGVAFSLRPGDFASWMLSGEPHRAGLVLPVRDADEAEVRSRRPGDRLRPLGAPGTRKLKEILIDRRIDRARRSCLPLLCVGGAIAWVPGVTIDDRFRVRGPEDPVWIAEIEPLSPSQPTLSTGRPAATGNPQAQCAVTPMEREPHALASEVAEP